MLSMRTHRAWAAPSPVEGKDLDIDAARENDPAICHRRIRSILRSRRLQAAWRGRLVHIQHFRDQEDRLILAASRNHSCIVCGKRRHQSQVVLRRFLWVIGSICCSFSLERLPPLCYPQRSRLFTLVALQLVGHPKKRAEDDGAVAAGQVYETGFCDETAEFDEASRALAALDLPGALVMSHPCGLMPVAPECRQRCGQLLAQFAAPVLERTRPRA